MNKASKKPILIAILLHFPIFATLYTAPFIINRDLFPDLNIDWIHFPIERWLIWVLPSVILINIFQKDLYVSLKEMFFNKVKLKTFLWCILPIVLYLIGGLVVSKYTGFSLNRPLREFTNTSEFLSILSENTWGSLVVPAIPEEMVFRAWILNAFVGKSPSQKRTVLAVIVSNILFVVIHLPTYFYNNYSMLQMFSGGLTVFILGSIFGIMFLKSKNIIVPILAHWLWDVFAFTFYG